MRGAYYGMRGEYYGLVIVTHYFFVLVRTSDCFVCIGYFDPLIIIFLLVKG